MDVQRLNNLSHFYNIVTICLKKVFLMGAKEELKKTKNSEQNDTCLSKFQLEHKLMIQRYFPAIQIF